MPTDVRRQSFKSIGAAAEELGQGPEGRGGEGQAGEGGEDEADPHRSVFPWAGKRLGGKTT